jgi:hypothetical protein
MTTHRGGAGVADTAGMAPRGSPDPGGSGVVDYLTGLAATSAANAWAAGQFSAADAFAVRCCASTTG